MGFLSSSLNLSIQPRKMTANNLESYDYELDSSLIALKPIYPKSAAKLLVYDRKSDKITHTSFKYLFDFIPTDCLIVLNDTKVIPARIYGHKPSGGKVELLYHKSLSDFTFLAQTKGKLKANDTISFHHITAKVLEVLDNGLKVIEFYDNDTLLDTAFIMDFLATHGRVPLPPYIKRSDTKKDRLDYQTVFAKNLGSIAAPTASLHLSDDDLAQITKRNHCFITLHIGAGTFFKVESSDITQHKMHKESFFIPSDSALKITNSDKVLCIGTTAMRCVEYFARQCNLSNDGDIYGECDIFINPLNPPIKASHLLTNFHLPKSSLIMLVAGLIGLEKTLEIYQIAQNLKYRFYSYGDGMLIL